MRTQTTTNRVDPNHYGQPLHDARLKAGRSLDDISRTTKIPAPMLERIERGDLDAMPAPVFVCGFLRAFARELKLDGEQAVARYRAVARSTERAQAHLIDDPRYDAEAPRVALAAGEEPPQALDRFITRLAARVPFLEGAIGRGPTFALVVLLVVLVARLTLSILLGGDPRPGRGLS